MLRNQLMARRALRVVVALTAVVVTAFAVGGASAVPSTPSPPFHECPAIGSSPSCGILIEFTDHGTNLLFDPSVPPFDNIEDTLVGVVNDSSAPVSSVRLSGVGSQGDPIFGFDGDGICSTNPVYAGRPAGCPFGPTTYEGPGTGFANISTDQTTGDVVFTGGLAPGAATYFSLEDYIVAVGINLLPTAAANPVGASHTVTATMTDALGNAVIGAPVTFAVTSGPDAGASGVCVPAACTTDLNGHVTFTFTNNGTAGTDTITASFLNIVGSAVTATAVKTFVDANVQIAPLSASNPVGTTHTLTGHVNVNDGSGAGYVNAPNGTMIIYSLSNSGGANGTFVGSSSCTTVNGTGSCTVVITSTAAGTTTIAAVALPTVGGVSLTRVTGQPGNSPNAVKTWTPVGSVRAQIAIAPSATAEVGTSQSFTVTLSKDTGTGSFVPAAGEHVTVGLTDSNGAAHSAPTGTCTNAGANTDANGQCTITFTSPSAGKVTGHATATLTINGTPVTVATDGTSGNSTDAVKTFVDANVQVSPLSATNPVGTTHTLTGHVNVNDGSGGGFVKAPAGTVVNFSLTNSNGAAADFVGPRSCTTAGTSGSCTVVISSPTTGSTSIHATTSVAVGGVALARATADGHAGDGPDVTKTWTNVRAQVAIAPSATNQVGVAHTFTVTLTKDTGTGTLVPAAGEHVTVTLTDSNGAAHTAPTGTCTNVGANTDANGQCTITFTSLSAGKVTGHASAALTIGGVPVSVQTDGTNGNSTDGVKTFVDANVQISPLSASNPVGTTHTLTGHVNVNAGSGAFANAPDGTVISFSLANGGGASAAFVGTASCTTSGGSGSCTVVISSTTAGSTSIHATTTIAVGGVSLTRATGDANAGDGPDATKTWTGVRAQIAIASSATAEVGTSQSLTVTLSKDTGTGTFVPAAGEHVTVTLTDSNGATHTAPSGTCTTAGANTDANGQCTITFTSPSAGKVTGHASATLTINGIPVTVQTDGTNGNSTDAVTTFVDANVQISPLSATNPVGTTHTLTGHVNVNAGDGAGFVNAPAGTVVGFSLANANGATATFVGQSSCTTASTSGSCTVVITSPTAGSTSIHATTSVAVGGVSLTRATNPDAMKTWTGVRARIAIAPSATNEVGASHTFTVTLSKDTGTGTFVPAAGEHVTVTLTDSNGAVHSAPTGTCTNAGANTDANGQCTITFTSASAGKVTGHASATLTINGVPVAVQTDGTNGNSTDAVKTFVDANVQLSPLSATNPVGTTHTLTGHVNVNPGAGAGFANAPDGTVIGFSLTNSGGATAAFVGAGSCTTANGTGSCTVVIRSTTAGSTTIGATTNVSVGGVALTRATGDAHAGDGPNATKTWTGVHAQISIASSASAEVGAAQSFTVTLSKDPGTGSFVPAAGEHVTVTLTDSNGAVHSAPAGTCTNAGANTDTNGRCTITFTSPSAGKVTGHATATLIINGLSVPVATDGLNGNSGDAVKTFVDASLQISPLSATNPVGTNHTLTGQVNVNAGTAFANAPDGTVINYALTNSGGATAAFVGPSTCTTSGGTGSCTVVTSSPTAGSTTIHAATTVGVAGVSLIRATGDSHAGDSPDAVKAWVTGGSCPAGPIGGINVGGITNDLFFFADGRTDANWQSSSPGYVGDVTVNGLLARERTSGTIAYAGTISTNDSTLGAWQKIVNDNLGQAFARYNQMALVTSRNNDLNTAFQQIDAMQVTPGFANRSSASLDGLNFQNGVNQTVVINVTSGFQVSKPISIFGDAGDVIVLRWDSDQSFANGYQGQVKFQSGGAIVPKGGLTPGNFINVAGDIDSSGGGKTPPPPYPQGPRLNNGTGALIPGAKDYTGGGFFTGYWLTTGVPTRPADATHVLPYGDTADQSTAIFVGGWYTFTTKFSLTSNTSGVHVCPSPTELRG
jgi:hypothetical protein